jgi:hypothetical protein
LSGRVPHPDSKATSTAAAAICSLRNIELVFMMRPCILSVCLARSLPTNEIAVGYSVREEQLQIIRMNRIVRSHRMAR